MVVLSQEPLPESLMQGYAAEFNVSETAFVWPLEIENGEEGNEYSLRWFTPVTEIELCGHATLASTYAACDFYGLTQVIFSTASGKIKARNQNGNIEIVMPRLDVMPVDESSKDYKVILSAVNQEVISIHKSKTKYLVELATEKCVENASSNILAIKSLDRNGVIITAKAEGKAYDFVSRYFAPKMGVDEDPVTGSAHSSLAPFWSNRLGKLTMTGTQLSKRGGEIAVNLLSDSVLMKGQCVVLFSGTN